jgi:peroxin-1
MVYTSLQQQGQFLSSPFSSDLTYACFSRPDLIDSALLRPGRIDKSLLCNMPDKHERYEVTLRRRFRSDCVSIHRQIMEAISSKIEMAPDVDLSYYAGATEGFSGADLQALLYNAHLEVVHSTLEHTAHRESDGTPSLEEEILQYTSFGGPTCQRVMSRAEQDTLTRRVNLYSGSYSHILI